MLADEGNLRDVHNFDHEWQSMATTRFGKNPQPGPAHSLECVGAGPGLEHAATQQVPSGLAYQSGGGLHLIRAFDRARASDHGKAGSADLNPANANSGGGAFGGAAPPERIA